jgi:hypothetical protein
MHDILQRFRKSWKEFEDAMATIPAPNTVNNPATDPEAERLLRIAFVPGKSEARKAWEADPANFNREVPEYLTERTPCEGCLTCIHTRCIWRGKSLEEKPRDGHEPVAQFAAGHLDEDVGFDSFLASGDDRYDEWVCGICLKSASEIRTDEEKSEIGHFLRHCQ